MFHLIATIVQLVIFLTLWSAAFLLVSQIVRWWLIRSGWMGGDRTAADRLTVLFSIGLLFEAVCLWQADWQDAKQRALPPVYCRWTIVNVLLCPDASHLTDDAHSLSVMWRLNPLRVAIAAACNLLYYAAGPLAKVVGSFCRLFLDELNWTHQLFLLALLTLLSIVWLLLRHGYGLTAGWGLCRLGPAPAKPIENAPPQTRRSIPAAAADDTGHTTFALPLPSSLFGVQFPSVPKHKVAFT